MKYARDSMAVKREGNNLLREQNALLARQVELLEAQGEQIGKMRWHIMQSREIQDEIRAGLTTPVLDAMTDYLAGRQLGLIETINTVRDQRLNLARFGDGEFKLMTRLEYNSRLQKNSPALMQALEDVFTTARNSPDRLLVGMPHPHRDRYWSNIYNEMWRQLQPRLDDITTVGNSQATRPILFSVYGQEAVEAWRSVWDGLSVTIVTGEGSRFDLLPELFDNLKSSRFEYSKPTHAFEDVPRLLDVLKGDASDLVLISLGPAGTVLASELAKQGRWALDVGHLSSSYAKEFQGGVNPEQVPLVR